MSKTVQELAIQLKTETGGLDTDIQKVLGGLKNFQSEIVRTQKANQDAARQVGWLEGSFLKASTQAEKFGLQLTKVREAQDALPKYQPQIQKLDAMVNPLQDSNKALARAKLLAGDKKTKELRAAQKNHDKLLADYKKENLELKKMSQALKDVGLDVKDLSNAEKQLAEQAASATEKHDQFAHKSEGLVKLKSHWLELTDTVKKCGGAMESAANWMTNMGKKAWNFTKDFAGEADNLSKQARAMNTTIENLQQVKYAASRSNVKDINSAVKTMVANTGAALMGKNRGVQDVLESRNFLNLNLNSLKGVDPKDLMLGIAKRFEDPKLGQEAKDKILKSLFGSQWEGMKDMLSQGYDSLQALFKEKQDIGVIDQNTGSLAETFDDNLTIMMEHVKSLREELGANLLPVMNDVVTKATEWVKQNKDWIKVELEKWVTRLSSAVRDVLGGLDSWADNIKDFCKSVSEIAGWIYDTVGQVWKFRYAFLALYGVLTASKIISAFSNIANVVGGIGSALWDGAKAVGGIGSSLLGLIGSGGPFVLITGAIAGLGTAGYLLYQNWDEVCQWCGDLWQGLKDTVSTVYDWVADLKLWDWVKTGFDAAIDGVKKGWAGLQDFFTLSEKDIKRADWAMDVFGGPDWIRGVADYSDEIADAVENVTDPKELMKQLGDINVLADLQKNFAGAIKKMSDEWQPFKDSLRDGFKNIFDVMGELVGKVTGEFVPAIQDAASAFQEMHTAASALANIATVSQNLNTANALSTQDGKRKAFATGGVVSRPQIALIGEAGPEAIIPLSKPSLGVPLLEQAASLMGLPSLTVEPVALPNTDTPQRLQRLPDFPEPPKLSSHASSGSRVSAQNMPNITWSPVFNISSSDGDAQDIAKQVEEVTRRSFTDLFKELMAEYQADCERVSFAAV